MAQKRPSKARPWHRHRGVVRSKPLLRTALSAGLDQMILPGILGPEAAMVFVYSAVGTADGATAVADGNGAVVVAVADDGPALGQVEVMRSLKVHRHLGKIP